MQPTFAIGDRVESADGSSDRHLMCGVWVATVVDVRPAKGASDGHCYITAGRWQGNDSAPLTTRQLHAEHLQLRND